MKPLDQSVHSPVVPETIHAVPERRPPGVDKHTRTAQAVEAYAGADNCSKMVSGRAPAFRSGSLLADAGFPASVLEEVLKLVHSSRRSIKGLWYDRLIAIVLLQCGAPESVVQEVLDIDHQKLRTWITEVFATRPVLALEGHLALWGAMVDQADRRLKALALGWVWHLYHRLIDSIFPGADDNPTAGTTIQETVAILIENPIERATFFESNQTMRDPEKATAAIQRVLGRGWSWGRHKAGESDCVSIPNIFTRAHS